jgi:hypothetical protein
MSRSPRRRCCAAICPIPRTRGSAADGRSRNRRLLSEAMRMVVRPACGAIPRVPSRPKRCSPAPERKPAWKWKALGVKDAASARSGRALPGQPTGCCSMPRQSGLPGGNGDAVRLESAGGLEGAAAMGPGRRAHPCQRRRGDSADRNTLVDTSSGVERSPGIKDVDKIAAFCKAALI